MEAAEGTTEGDEIARLCVNKLRAMLVVEGDPNLRYVALLAFVKITSSHADLVSQHQDVILECIDDPDISIRTRALDLIAGMVNANNLQTVVERLLRQLRSAGKASAVDEHENDRAIHDGIIPMADDEEDSQATIRAREQKSKQAPPLPDDYRTSVIERILDMCSRETYTNLNDFEWYIGVLVELVKQCPSSSSTGKFGALSSEKDQTNISDLIGSELLNVAVRVKAVRPEAAAAAQSLLVIEQRELLFPSGSTGGQGVLRAAAFVAGEYASMLPDAEAVLTSLLHASSAQLPATTLTSYLQAIPKVFAALTSSQEISWTSTRRGTITLLVARVIHFMEPLTLHPSLEVQERAVEYLDLMRLASEAASNQEVEGDGYAEPPLLLTQAIPALFSGMELNPVAATAIRKVPQPEDLDLDTPINSDLLNILNQADYDTDFEDNNDDVYKFYHEKPSAVKSAFARPAADLLEPPSASRSTSYQSGSDESVDRESLLRKKAERRERYKDDPYYIDSERGSGASTPMHNILKNANGEDLNVDDIPVMELKLDPRETAQERHRPIPSHPVRKQKKHFEIAGDETLGGDDIPASYSSSPSKASSAKTKRSLLQLDSSGLSSLSLDDTSSGNAAGSRFDVERRVAEDEEMARAIKEVERLRLEMQRAQERIQPRDMPEEGTVVKRKKKKERKVEVLDDGAGGEGEGQDTATKKKKKKKKKVDGAPQQESEPAEAATSAEPVKVKRKKKRQVMFDDDDGGE